MSTSLFNDVFAKGPCRFKEDDIVVLKTGKSPQRVIGVCFSGTRGWMLRCTYDIVGRYAEFGTHDLARRWRSEYDFVHYMPEPTPDETQGEPDMADLYQTKEETPRFGTMLTKNSAGQYVLEMKGEGGKVEAFNEDAIEIVMPYTIAMELLAYGMRHSVTGGPNMPATIHTLAEPGKVQKNDILIDLHTGGLWRVSAVDTKFRQPKEIKGGLIRIPSEKLTLGKDK